MAKIFNLHPEGESRHDSEQPQGRSLTIKTHSVESVLTIDDLCDFLQLNKKAIYHQVETKGLPCFKIAGKLRFRLSEVVEWMEGLRVPNQSEIPSGSKKTKGHQQVGSGLQIRRKENPRTLPSSNQERSSGPRVKTEATAHRLIDIEATLKEAGKH